ncbi:MAG: gliding motility lipoprotein GldH [Candidatus Cyclobacteriaceae bacterium M2_1C_046]
MRNILFLFIVIIFSCCDPERVYEENEEFAGGIWHVDSIPVFDFSIQEEGTYDVYLNIRNTLEYPFQNLYVTYYLEDTLGQVLKTDLVNFKLFDPKTGKPYGEGGIGDIYGHQFLLLDAHQFENQKYQMRVQHYMRTDSLRDILAVGIRVEENDEVE